MSVFFGSLVRFGVSIETTRKIIDAIRVKKGDLRNPSNKWYEWALNPDRGTYARHQRGENIPGKPLLTTAIQQFPSFKTNELAEKEIDTFYSILATASRNSSNDKPDEKTEVDLNKKMLELRYELLKEIPSGEFFEYAISMTRRVVKRDPALIYQIYLTSLSSKSQSPQNLGIMAPAGEVTLTETEKYTIQSLLKMRVSFANNVYYVDCIVIYQCHRIPD